MAAKTVLNDTPRRLLKKYRQALIKAGIPVKQMILFGSHAKGTAKPWSDVDVCIVSSLFGKNAFKEMVRLSKLTASVDTMIEPHPFSPGDLNDPYDSLAQEIRRYGKTII